jgi:hypothetical protein
MYVFCILSSPVVYNRESRFGYNPVGWDWFLFFPSFLPSFLPSSLPLFVELYASAGGGGTALEISLAIS